MREISATKYSMRRKWPWERKEASDLYISIHSVLFVTVFVIYLRFLWSSYTIIKKIFTCRYALSTYVLWDDDLNIVRCWVTAHSTCVAVTDTQTTIEEMLEAISSLRSVTSVYNQGRHVKNRRDHVEAVSNTSTVTLRAVGGDEKESLKSETVKYGCEYNGTRIRERLRWQGPEASHQRGCPTKTRP
jgi:hypothetical protein